MNANENHYIEQICDGMIGLLRKNMSATTALLQDAVAGTRTIRVNNTLRFHKDDQIVLQDRTAVWNEDRDVFEGLEFHTIRQVVDTNTLLLSSPLKRNFSVAQKGFVQRALKNAFVYPKDILYGDREVVTWDQVAICVDPLDRSTEFMAINGLTGDTWGLDILVYVKMGSVGENIDGAAEEQAQRTCNRYCDAIYNLLLGNIHLDLAIDDVPLTRDVQPGDNFVYIPVEFADDWPVDHQTIYEVQDNNRSAWSIALVDPDSTSSSESTSMTSTLVSNSSSTSTFLSTAMMSSSTSHSASSISHESSESSLSSSSSSLVSGWHKVWISATLSEHFRVADKAVLRRNARYMYTSQPSNATYGVTQKGEYLLKAGKISWSGKESQVLRYPQVGKGGKSF